MKKHNAQWTINELQERYESIEFPEFQREPTVWDLPKKIKLIDSILRSFDIATIYLYKRKDGNYECIDGRQRINAIISFLGLNEQADSDDEAARYHNNFRFTSSDDLLGTRELESFNKKRWAELTSDQRPRILDYKINVVEVSDIQRDDELNLMFLRLQLGAPLIAGEKLKAMLGQMRDYIFGQSSKHDGLGKHAYFEYLEIPKRRFSRELTASQIALNFFSLRKSGQFARARFVDLQEFYKSYREFSGDDRKIADLLGKRLDKVESFLPPPGKLNLRNRAIGVTFFFFINELIENKQEDRASSFINFMATFLGRLSEQVKKGIDIDKQYRDLLTFQTYVSQAAVEKYAIENRQTLLRDYFSYYLKTNKIKGDG